MQKERIDRRWTGENGREITRRANEKGIRRTLSTSNRAGSKSPKDSNTSTRWGSVKTSERIDGTHLNLLPRSPSRKEEGRTRETHCFSIYGRNPWLKGVRPEALRRERTHLDEILGIVGIEFSCHCFVVE